MSEFKVQVIKINNMTKLENSDMLSIVNVWNYPVVVRTEEFKVGDLAIYCPIDSLFPKDDPQWEFLGSSRRLKAKKLRGIYSQGMLVPAPVHLHEGDDAQAYLKITKYEPPEDVLMQTESEANIHNIPIYTDISGYRRYPNIFKDGDEVSISEKIHGSNARFAVVGGRLWVGSHKLMKKENPLNMWWKVAEQYKLALRLAPFPNILIFAEVYGQVQSLKYGVPSGFRLALFDAMDLITRRYFDYADFKDLAAKLDLPTVPELYTGPWKPELTELRNGKSTIADNVREGIVIKPLVETVADFEGSIDRKILKLVGEDYLLSKHA